MHKTLAVFIILVFGVSSLFGCLPKKEKEEEKPEKNVTKKENVTIKAEFQPEDVKGISQGLKTSDLDALFNETEISIDTGSINELCNATITTEGLFEQG
jgi:hypothetical protein